MCSLRPSSASPSTEKSGWGWGEEDANRVPFTSSQTLLRYPSLFFPCCLPAPPPPQSQMPNLRHPSPTPSPSAPVPEGWMSLPEQSGPCWRNCRKPAAGASTAIDWTRDITDLRARPGRESGSFVKLSTREDYGINKAPLTDQPAPR